MELHRVDSNRDDDRVKIEGEVFLGRGPLLRITDVALSRNVARISCHRGSFTLTAAGAKPAFHKAREAVKFDKVGKDDTVDLADGDVISLLKDKYLYKVVMPTGLPTEEQKVKGEEEEPKEKEQEQEVKGEKEKSRVHGERVLPEWMMKQAGGVDSGPVKGPIKAISRPAKKTSSSKLGLATKVSLDVVTASLLEKPNESPSKQKSTQVCKEEVSLKSSPAKKPKINFSPTKGSSTKRSAVHELSDAEDSGELVQGSSPRKPFRGGSPTEDDTEKEEEEKVNRKSPVKRPLATANTKATRSQHHLSEEDDDEGSTLKKPRADDSSSKRKSCGYGAGCYRRNPAHRQEEAHPGDDDYEAGRANADSEEEVDKAGDEDDRPECEYGADCYRKNPQHRKDFKHTARFRRAKAKAAEKRKKKKQGAGEEGDEDYDSSFIDDDSDLEDISGDDASEDVWAPDDDSE